MSKELQIISIMKKVGCTWSEAEKRLIEEKKLNKYKPIHRAKTFIHSYLAVQEDPGTPMGLAITKRYLTTDEKNCLNLINWLKKTFRD